MNFLKDFLEFSQEPFIYPIQFQSGCAFIDLLFYSYLINYNDDVDANKNSNKNDDELHFKRIFIDANDGTYDYLLDVLKIQSLSYIFKGHARRVNFVIYNRSKLHRFYGAIVF